MVWVEWETYEVLKYKSIVKACEYQSQPWPALSAPLSDSFERLVTISTGNAL